MCWIPRLINPNDGSKHLGTALRTLLGVFSKQEPGCRRHPSVVFMQLGLGLSYTHSARPAGRPERMLEHRAPVRAGLTLLRCGLRPPGEQASRVTHVLCGLGRKRRGTRQNCSHLTVGPGGPWGAGGCCCQQLQPRTQAEDASTGIELPETSRRAFGIIESTEGARFLCRLM